MLHSDSGTNITIVNNVSKIIEKITTNFTKRYLVVPTELEEMKLEFMNNISRTNEYITNIKKVPSLLKPHCK